MASKPRAFAKVFLPVLPPPPLITAPVFPRQVGRRSLALPFLPPPLPPAADLLIESIHPFRPSRPTTRAAGAAAMSAAATPPAQAPRKWEGLVDEALEREVLGACLDQAPERRRVREAFKDVQLSIDHCLFKVNPLLCLSAQSHKERCSKTDVLSFSVLHISQ